MTAPHRVIKLGGSLLECEGLVGRFRAWRAAQPGMQETMIVGGGSMADAVRDACARRALGEEDAHWLCIRIMGITAEGVSRWLPEADLATQIDDLPAGPGLRILQPEPFLRDERPQAGRPPLPRCWDATSDSIAARVAEHLGAAELVLLKSSLPRPPHTPQALAAAGYVDRYFPVAAARIPRVRCVNLRETGFPETRLP